MTWKFSRSHQIAYHRCPRECYLRYYADGTGYESRIMNIGQSTGTLLHSMIAETMGYLKDHDAIPGEDTIALVAKSAVAAYRTEASDRGIEIEQNGSMEFELVRQSFLAEGFLWAWYRLRLPEVHEKYKVVAVEEEWEVPLSPDSNIVTMIRIDSVLEDRETGDLWPMECKTTAFMSSDWCEKWRYDTQTLMHSWATEQKFGSPCGGVIMEVFFKGQKGKDKETGNSIYYSPLVRGYVNHGVPPFNETEYSWDSAVGRRKGWSAINSWDLGSARQWIEMIPLEILQEQITTLEVYRSDREVETWLRQTQIEQSELARLAYEIGFQDNAILDRYFPARLNADCYSNKYRQKCIFLDTCYKGIWPNESDSFRARQPHHETEFE